MYFSNPNEASCGFACIVRRMLFLQIRGNKAKLTACIHSTTKHLSK
ncbi:hypothetical protein M23134_01873 [Microscilla marina ATCC 23134]|uniref:Uncharacterized protein n=1 Tax=Microscilla marina ATCC 23134 TaxID=313606 RepID=A1ZC42_MICM2|nr:hypothetical protein M23134_01873 [Microscilla marina ATCC 23134]